MVPQSNNFVSKIQSKYFMHLLQYNFIFQIDKKWVNFGFFWNTLSPALFTNTVLTVNTLFTNTGLAVNTLTINKACLYFIHPYLE